MLCWARTLLILVVAVLGTLSMLNACGQKGDLYLPEQDPPRGDERRTMDDVPQAPKMPAGPNAGATQPSS